MTEIASLHRLGVWDALVPRLEKAGWVTEGRLHPDAVPVLEEMRRGPDPEGGLDRMTAILATDAGIAERARSRPLLGKALAAVCGASPALARTVRADPGWLDDAVADHPLPMDTAAVVAAPDPVAALRRYVRRRMLRIAVGDLLRLIDMPEAGRQLAALADTAAGIALATAAPVDVPFAVIAMGKWGGRELNYASDIDLLFVYDGPSSGAAEARRVAEAFTQALNSVTPDGLAFRVDADLRPEGRSGPLARTLAAYRSYYERWAETWEFQALIKARPAAGETGLGNRFMEMIEPFVYPETLGDDAVRAVRAMKRRTEEQTAARGRPDQTELKRGVGGIRDVEFAVQLLQLVHGRADAALRSAGTLDVLSALGAGGYVRPDDAEMLADSYRWLRDVEHRIQMVELRQTHVLPGDPTHRERIAKAMGHRDRPNRSALEDFEADLVRHRASVRTIHERLFYRPLLEAFAASPAGAPSQERTERQAAALGFRDVPAARRAVADLTSGLSRRSRLMQQLLPLMLDWLSASPNPDLGLRQLRALVTGSPDHAALVAALRDNPVAAERLCRLLGTSRLLGQYVDRLPESLAFLADDDQLAAVPDRAALIEEAKRAAAIRPDRDAALRSLRIFVRRGRLRIAIRDLLGLADMADVGRELSDLADATAEAALRVAAAAVRQRPEYGGLDPMAFAVIAMGKWGGRELNYASDLDLLLVYRPPAAADADTARRFALRVAEGFFAAVGGVTPEGAAFQVDLDLRPEGKQGPLARSLDSYRAYYERWAQTWEFQSLLKARAAAGDADLGDAFERLAAGYAYPDRPGAEALRDIRTMKARIERERIQPDEDADFHMKLGPGGLADVEFTTQLLQYRHGGADPRLRTTETLAALAAMAEARVLDADEASRLEAAYRFCGRVRNRLYLQAGRTRDSLPADPGEVARLGVSLGLDIHPTTTLRERYRRLTRRARRVVERRFYGSGG